MDWSGPYVGIDGGYGWGKASTSFPGDGDDVGIFGSGDGTVGEPPDGDFDQQLHREVYGLHAGFNTRIWNDFYGGFEAAYEQGNILATSQNNLPNSNFPGMTVDYMTRVNALFSLAPQVGYAWERVLFHAKGGLAVGRVASIMSNLSSTNINGVPTTFGQDQTRIGWMFGLGADYALTDHWLVGLAYDEYDLGTIQYGGEGAPDTSYALSYEVHPILRTVSARVSYKFAGEGPSTPSWDEERESERMNWTGPYIGVNGGYGWGEANTAFDGDGDADGTFGDGSGIGGEPSDGDFNQALHREVYGLHFGYNVTVWRNLLAGFEATYDQADVLAESQNVLTSAQFPASTTSEVLRINSLFSLAPQVGVAWDRLLFRAKGGVAAGRTASHLYSSAYDGGEYGAATGATTYGQDQTHIGWMWGLGVDYALTDHWIAGLAFDYYDLGTIHYGGLTTPDSWWPLSYEVHPILRAATFRLSYKFGGEAPPSGDAQESELPQPPAPAPAAAPVTASVIPADPLVGPLIQSLEHGEVKARAEAAIRLGELRSYDAVDPLVTALGDPSLAVRGTAADALGKIGDRRAEAPLSALLLDSEPKVRALAARALGALGDSQALPALRKTAARDSNPLVRKIAAAAAKRLSQPGSEIDELLQSN
jgi:opacity protein-like surface antigen